MKKFLEDLLKRSKARRLTLAKSIVECETKEERQEIQNTIDELDAEINQAEAKLTEIETEEAQAADNENEENRSAFNINNVLLTTPMNAQRNVEVSPYATIEYRTAFKNYVQKGTVIPTELRAGGDEGTTVVADIGAIIPETIMNEFIKEVSKVYGHIYAKVRKLNVQGGVKFPISKLKANFKWISETTTSKNQKAGDIKDFVIFNYHIGEIRVAQSLLSQVVSLALFESEIVKIMIEAFVEMMDKVIISGSGDGQPLGITKDPRVKNVIYMTEAEFADWTAWRKKLFAVVPLSKRGQGEFLFPSSTVETYLLTMKDKNDKPLFKEATDLSVGNISGSFFGKPTDLVEPDVITEFALAGDGDVVGVFWIPNDYGINTNLQFGMKRWFDEDENEYINKGLVIVDGKMIDPSGCYLIKKRIEG